MLITPKNWMDLVAATLDELPAVLRETLAIKPEVVERMQCRRCERSWFLLAPEGPRCARCHVFDFTLSAVDLGVDRPRISICQEERLLVSAVLLRRGKTVEVIVPEAVDSTFRVRSRRIENSAEALQRCVRGVAFGALGLVADAEGFWGWAGGERLQGGAMVPYPIDLLDQFQDEAGIEPSVGSEPR